MKRLFQKWLFLFVALAFLATIATSWHIQTTLVRNSALEILRVNIEDVKVRLDKSAENLDAELTILKKSALSKARAWTQIVNDDPSILKDQARMVDMAKRMDVVELNVSDENGVLIASNIPEYVGYHMDAKPLTAEFMPAITNPNFELVQKPRPNPFGGYYQYAGVARKDSPGIAQVGVEPGVIGQAISAAEFNNIAASVHIGLAGSVRIHHVYVQPEKLKGFEQVTRPVADGKSETTWEYVRYETVDEVPSLSLSVLYKDLMITTSIPNDEVFVPRSGALIVQSIGNLVLFIVVFILISILLQRVVIRGVYSVNDSLGKITNGDLNELVDVSTTPEFVSLSKGVNATVAALKKSIENEAKRIDAELEMGRAIQLSVLPTDFPNDEKLELAGSLTTAKEVGGDFYDFFYLDPKHFLVEIADVSGKGIAAALFMMSAKTLLRKVIQTGAPLEKAIERANAELCRGNSAYMFLTAFFVILDVETGELTCVDGGHNPPLFKRKYGKWEYLRVKPSLIVGVDETAKYSSEKLHMNRGDMLFLYTDGVSEAMNPQNVPLGEERLLDSLDSIDGSPEEIVAKMRAAVTEYADGAPQSDDVTELLLMRK